MKKLLIALLLLTPSLAFAAPTGANYLANLLQYSTTTTGCLNGKLTSAGVVTTYFTGSDCGTGTGTGGTANSKWATSSGTTITPNGGGGILVNASSTFTSLLNLSNASSSKTTLSTTWFSSLPSALLSTDANGLVSATTSIGTNYITGVLGTINGTSFSRGDSITVSSTTLLTDNNTFSGKTTLGNATSSNFAITGLLGKLLATDANGNVVATTSIGTNYLAANTISGVALGGTLAALTATDSSLTFSGSYTGTTARTVGLNVGNANVWTALQRFSSASSTSFSNFGTAYFGGTATSSFSSAGVLTLASALAIGSGGTATTTQVTNGVNYYDGTRITSAPALLFNGTSLSIGTSTFGTLLNLNGVANFSTATSTFYSSGGINLTSGCFAVAGICLTSGSGGGSWPFTPTTNYGVAVQSTSTPLWLTTGVMASSTSYFVNASTTAVSVAGTLFASDGAATAPSITFTGDSGLGLSNNSGALRVSVANGSCWQFATNGLRGVGGGSCSTLGVGGTGTAAAPNYTFNIDSDTGIFAGNTNFMGFSTAGIERGRFDAAGRFGLSTTSPFATFSLVADHTNTYNATVISVASSTPTGTTTLLSLSAGGLLSMVNASSTSFTNTGATWLTGLSGGTGSVNIDSNGKLYSGATTTAGTGLTYSGGSFNCNTATASVFGCLTAANWATFNAKVATSAAETKGQLAVWGTTNGTPAQLYSVATTAVACSGNISCTSFNAIGAASTISFTGTLAISNGGTATTTGGVVKGIYFWDGVTHTNNANFTFSTTSPANLLTVTSASTTNLSVNLTQIIGDGSGASLITPTAAFTMSFASTSAMIGTTTTIVGPAPYNMTVTQVMCNATSTSGGSPTLNIQPLFGSTLTAPLAASTTVGTQVLSSNNTVTKGAVITVYAGTPASSPNGFQCTFRGPQTGT